MIKAIIIDDEIEGANLLKNLLDYYCKQIEVVSIASNSIDGLALTIERKPDVLFLDIEMPHLNGFELLEKLQGINVHIIFTTANSQYALKAIKCSALDYLLKPIHPTDLLEAVRKVEKIRIEKSQALDFSNSISTLLSVIKQQEQALQTVNAGHPVENNPNHLRFRLTKREIEIIQMLAEGKTTSQIAVNLFRSKSTVDKHVQNIYEKLGVSKKSELLQIWTTQN